jgi:hypothetical protein
MPEKAKQPKRGFSWRKYENSQLRNVLVFSVVLYKFMLKGTVACEHDKIVYLYKTKQLLWICCH